MPTTRALDELLARAPEMLAPFGVSEEQSALVACLHLLEVAVRFVRDDQMALGNPLGDVEAWLLPVLEQRVGLLTESHVVGSRTGRAGS